jgi:pimeloyl-ACP methyl ester carboxylesterase
MNTTLLAVIAGVSAGGLIFLLLALHALRKGRIIGSLTTLLAGLVLILAAAVVLLISVGTKGYLALTREDLAATVHVTPLGSQQFQAEIVRPNMRDTLFAVAGDEFYIDARIIKWKPLANLVGLHTVYRLDRVSGRYLDIQDESTKVRTLYSLGGPMKPWDLFCLRAKYQFLAPLLDAQYGSATFVPVKDRSVLRVMVTTSGLMIRSEEGPP